MSSPYIPAGPEATPTSQISQPVASPTLTPQSSSSDAGVSPASTASVVVFLSLFSLAVLVAASCWVRRRRTKTMVSDERPSENALACDVEALPATQPIVPVTPLPDVRWTPQIRSISGPALDWDSRGKLAAYPKRIRSPPPSNLTESRNAPPGPYPKSAPARAASFSQNEISYLEKSLGEEFEPPVTPQAVAASGMQTRSLRRSGIGGN